MRITLRKGSITKFDDRVIFETSDGKGRAEFPLQAETCLHQLQQGAELESYIVESHSRGKTVDYIALKTVVLGLYHGNCVKNRDEITPYIDTWSHPPLREPTLFFPILRAKPRQAEAGEGLFLFSLTSFAFLAFVTLSFPFAAHFVSGPARFWAMALLAPGAILSAMALFFHAISPLIGHTSAGLGARLSPSGFHFESETSFYRHHPLTGVFSAFTFSALAPLFVGKIVLAFAPDEISHAIVRSLFEGLSAAFVSVQLLPGLRSSWSVSRFELAKRGKLQGLTSSSMFSTFYMASAILGLCLGLGFVALRLLDALRVLGNPTQIWESSHGVGFVVLAVGICYASFMLRDMFHGIEQLADDVQLFKPVQNKIEKLWESVFQNPKVRDQKEISEILNFHSLFQQLPADFRSEISSQASIIHCSAGSRLIRQDSQSTDLFILLSGSVGVYRRQYDQSESRLIVQLNAGAVFGEAGFFFGETRTADVIALDTIRVLRIKRPARAMAKQSPEAHEAFRLKMWASQALSNSDIFRHLPTEALFQILNGSEIVRMNKGEFVTLEGEPSDSLWICVQGSAKVSVGDLARPDIKMGDVIGEIGLIWNTQRTATVISNNDSIYLKLPAWQVRSLFSRNILLAARLQELGAERLYRDKKSKAA